jgi:hypothetical protein
LTFLFIFDHLFYLKIKIIIYFIIIRFIIKESSNTTYIFLYENSTVCPLPLRTPCQGVGFGGGGVRDGEGCGGGVGGGVGGGKAVVGAPPPY